jgi:putative hydrolase of the HAD superfamily
MFKAVVFDLGNTLVEEGSGSLLPFAVSVLKELKKKYKLGLITNTLPETKREKIMSVLSEAGIGEYFDEVLVSSELGFGKPDPRIFHLMLSALNVKPEESIMIGNTISTDIFGGNGVGMLTVLIQPEDEYNRSEWERPDYVIKSLDELNLIL